MKLENFRKIRTLSLNEILLVLIKKVYFGQIQFYFQKQPFADDLQNRCLKNFVIFTGKHLCCSIFKINLQTFRPATLLIRDSKTGVIL